MDRRRSLLKDRLFNRDKVARMAGELSHAHRAFDADGFENQVMARLPELELKQRIAWITDCLGTHLPGGTSPRLLPGRRRPQLQVNDIDGTTAAPSD
jgi:hypothetical protein